MTFFFHSNPFSKSFPFFQVYHSIKLPIATSDFRKFNDPVQKMLTKLFRSNVRYHKYGVLLQGITGAIQLQADFFRVLDSAKTIELMNTIDGINHRFGRDTLRFGSSGFNLDWKTQARMKLSHFTTKWDDFMIVKL